MPAGNEDIHDITEARAIALLEGIQQAGAQRFHVARFYGTFDPQALYGFIRSKMNTADGSMFVRATDDQNEPRNTVGTMYRATVPIEVLVAYPAHAEKQLGEKRFTSEMITQARAALVGEKVTFSDQTARIYYAGSQSLLRTDELDAQLARFELRGVNIDFNETI